MKCKQILQHFPGMGDDYVTRYSLPNTSDDVNTLTGSMQGLSADEHVEDPKP